jgi:hypothetical protein
MADAPRPLALISRIRSKNDASGPTRGTASPERTLEQIARMMARGQVRVLPNQDGGMIDRAWNALMAGLRKFSKTNETSDSAT